MGSGLCRLVILSYGKKTQMSKVGLGHSEESGKSLDIISSFDLNRNNRIPYEMKNSVPKNVTKTGLRCGRLVWSE